MTTANQQGIATFQATATAIAQGVRVAIDSAGKVSAASDSVAGIGVTEHAVAASGYVAVKLWNANGTFMILASGSITTGDTVGAAASGAVLTDGATSIGQALSDAVDGSLVEVAASVGGSAAPTEVAAHAASHADGGSDEVELAIGQVTGLAAALASADAEAPAWANDFTTDATGLTALSSGTIGTPSGSAVVVSTAATPATTGVQLSGQAQATDTEYALVLYVTTAPAVQWQIRSKATSGFQIGVINSAGWHTFAWVATSAENGQYPVLIGVSQTGSITLGYGAIYEAPSSTLKSLAGLGADANLVRENDTYIAAGLGLRRNTSGYLPSHTAGTVNLSPGGMAGASGVTAGNTVIGQTGTSATGTLFGMTTAAGGENVAVGDYSAALSWRTTAVGNRALAVPVSSAAYGFDSFVGLPHSIAMARMGSIAANTPAESFYTGTSLFCAEPIDVFFGGGTVHRMAHPSFPSLHSIVTDDRGQYTSNRHVRIHGPDAFDSRSGGTAESSSRVADTTARDAITVANRWPGMMVYCSTEEKTFLLNAAFDPTTIKRVKSLSRSGTTITLTFWESHGLAVNDVVTFWGASSTAYNGTYTVTTVPDSSASTNAKQITFEHGTSGTVAETEQHTGMCVEILTMDNAKWEDLSRMRTGSSDEDVRWGRTTTHVGRTSGTVKLWLSAVQFFSRGNTIAVAGITVDASMNGDFTVTSVTPAGGESYVIEYTCAGSDVSKTADTGGTVVPKDARSLNQDGRDIIMCAGRQTGTGTGGDFLVQTSPAGAFGANTKGTPVTALKVDKLIDASNNKTRFHLLDTATGTLRRVEFGAADSGGTGYRMLRTEN